jgi:hypothetical protein
VQHREVGVGILAGDRGFGDPSASCTRMESAPAITCWLVTMVPAGSMITPEPRLRSMRRRYAGQLSPNICSIGAGAVRSVTTRAV